VLEVGFQRRGRSPFRILCLGAHCDDIEIGCGGTILRLARELPGCEIRWVVFSSSPERRGEALACANRFLKGARFKQASVGTYRDSFLRYSGEQIKEEFEEIKAGFSPDVIFTHYRDDLHQDHRLLCEFTWNTFRNHLILEYEIPKYDGDLGRPNFYVTLTEAQCRKKIKLILDCFRSQRTKHWFDEATFRSLLRLRGMEANAPTRFAEAFYCRKMAF
jgi:LmbE family N-acetylglucosaminyl deacetylase